MATETVSEHDYECTGCGGMFDDRDGPPLVIPPRRSSPDGLPDVICPRCRAEADAASAAMEAELWAAAMEFGEGMNEPWPPESR